VRATEANGPTNARDPSGLVLKINGKLVKKSNDDPNYKKLIAVSKDKAVEEILSTMINANGVLSSFEYSKIDILIKEIKYRLLIISAAKQLDKVGAGFEDNSTKYATIKNKKGIRFWKEAKTAQYQYTMLRTVGRDLEKCVNELYGKTGSQFKYECASAMTVVVMKAWVDYQKSIKKSTKISETLAPVEIAGWLQSTAFIENIAKTPLLPGDVIYLVNPKATSDAWKGENLIYLGQQKYYGHGRGKNKGIMTGGEWRRFLFVNHSNGGLYDYPYWNKEGGRQPNFSWIGIGLGFCDP
jgi:hypothetical protein